MCFNCCEIKGNNVWQSLKAFVMVIILIFYHGSMPAVPEAGGN